MHICFIEDTTLHGGTQIWVSEAMRAFRAAGHEITLLTAAGGFNAVDAAELDVRLVTYDYDDVTPEMCGIKRSGPTRSRRPTLRSARCTRHATDSTVRCSLPTASPRRSWTRS